MNFFFLLNNHCTWVKDVNWLSRKLCAIEICTQDSTSDFFPLRLHSSHQYYSWLSKVPTKKKNSRDKIWSPSKFGSMGINWIIRKLRILRNPFQNTPRNIKFPNSAKSNRVALLCTVKAWNNQLFWQFDWFFLKEAWKWL